MNNLKVLKIAALGVGNRTRKYLKYVTAHPESCKLEMIVENSPKRLEDAQMEYGLPEENCFASAEEFFRQKRDIDVVIVGTPDCLHFHQCMSAISHGYHVLLEKPIAQTEEECRLIDEAARAAGVKVAVCYVLRFHPYFKKLKEILCQSNLGKIISIHHTIDVGLDRMMHTYVRGPWGVAEDTTPIFLSKCCHDVDILLWLLDSRPIRVSSFGSLRWFCPENVPENSTDRCITCPVEKNCPFSAVEMYRRRKVWIDNFVVSEGQTRKEVIEEELRSGRFGRCVFRCGNDVMDNQITSFDTTDGVLVDITMVSMTREDGRRLRINCACGEIFADGNTIEVRHFNGNKPEFYDFTEINKLPLHSNADFAVIEDLLESVHNPEHPLKSSIHDAIDSHLLCFKAEESRLAGEVKIVYEKE